MKAAAQIAKTIRPPGSAADLEGMLGQNPMLTKAGSRFADEVWDLSLEMQAVRKPACEKRLDFRMRPCGRYRVKYAFPDGKGLADYPAFQAHAKRLLAVMILSPRNQLGPIYQPKTLINTIHGLKRIYSHLARAGCPSLATVSEARFGSFARQIDTYNSSLLGTLRLIHIYHDLVPGFGFDAWEVAMRTPQARASAAKRDQNQTDPIPDGAFRQLLRVCLAYVDERADRILDARDALARWRRRKKSRRSGYPRPECRIAHAQLWGEIAQLHGKHQNESVRFETAADVFNACRDLQRAAVVLLFAITGMRLNEVLTIRSGCIKRTRKHSVERIWLESVHRKYADRSEGDPSRWLCGPVGAQAVAVLERLSAPTRRESGLNYLIGPIAESGRHRITNPLRAYRGGSAAIFFSPRGWWARFLSQHRITGPDGRVAHIHAHQFRRTFARWCALCDNGTGLLALKDHFKHASILMTRHYARIDDELLLLYEAEKDRVRAESFDKVLCSEALGGAGGRLLKRKIDTAIEDGDLPREFRGMAGAPLRTQCIKNWLQSGVQLRACAGHYCVPIDPLVVCDEIKGIGCNKGVCPNAVFHPEHAAGLAEKIGNDRRTLDVLDAATPASPYVAKLREHVRVQEKILRDIAGATA